MSAFLTAGGILQFICRQMTRVTDRSIKQSDRTACARLWAVTRHSAVSSKLEIRVVLMHHHQLFLLTQGGKMWTRGYDEMPKVSKCHYRAQNAVLISSLYPHCGAVSLQRACWKFPVLFPITGSRHPYVLFFFLFPICVTEIAHYFSNL